MGGGSFNARDFGLYSKSVGKIYNNSTGRVSNQVFTAERLKEVLNPKGVIRECCNSDEHPNTIPVILGLDVTGSMGSACNETAQALGQIMTKLYDKYKDIEFCIMGIGDFECDDAPLQVSQFESDVRIAQRIDDIYMEHGGGGNGYESYSAAWYFGLYKTKLDAFTKQSRKGIIITMGDEPLNPDLPAERLKQVLDERETGIVKTPELYKKACEKFDIFHISINDSSSSYDWHKQDIERTFNPLLGERVKVSTIDNLANTIVGCIDESLKEDTKQRLDEKLETNENGQVTW